jgi:hypothetical protein
MVPVKLNISSKEYPSDRSPLLALLEVIETSGNIYA